MFRGRVLQEGLKDGFGRPVARKLLLEDRVFFVYLVDRLVRYCVVHVKFLPLYRSRSLCPVADSKLFWPSPSVSQQGFECLPMKWVRSGGIKYSDSADLPTTLRIFLPTN